MESLYLLRQDPGHQGHILKSFRSYFMDSMDIQRVHLFESRNSVFKGKEGHSDDILQETMITYGKKSKSQSRNIIIAISQNAQDLGKVKEIQVEREIVCQKEKSIILYFHQMKKI